MRVKMINDPILLKKQKKEKESAVALITYEDISDGGGVYND